MAKKHLKLGQVLKRLLFAHDIRPADLSREVKIPQPTIHRLITGKSKRPYKSSLKPIADYFSVRVEQLTGEEPLPSGLTINEAAGTLLTKNKICFIPLIAWENLNFTTAANGHKKIPQEELFSADNSPSNEEKIPFLGPISDDGFATLMPDYSMEPVFPRDSLLIFDPDKVPKDRSYVLVKLHSTKQLVFRQLLIDLDHKYLKPLNPDLNAFEMRLLGEHDTIHGTLVEARRMYKDA